MYLIHCSDDMDVVRQAYEDGVSAGKAIGNKNEFMECDDCRAKPGSPALCWGCIHNRALITRLKSARKKTNKGN